MPTAFVSGFRALANQLGAIPGQFGVHLWSVDLVTNTWTGDYVGEGTETQTVTPLTRADGQPPRVKFNSNRRLMLGVADAGIYEIGPLTPVEGVSWTNLTQSGLAANTTVKIRLTHAEDGEVKWCTIETVNNEKALGVRLTVKEEAAK